MAKKCIKVAASKRSKAHIRCFEGTDPKDSKKDVGKSSGGNSKPPGGNGSGGSGGGFKDPYSGNYEKARISKGEVFGSIFDL